ncbi:MAG: hypothetical protein AAF725_25680 [Acidobacteriota bacterium]
MRKLRTALSTLRYRARGTRQPPRLVEGPPTCPPRPLTVGLAGARTKELEDGQTLFEGPLGERASDDPEAHLVLEGRLPATCAEALVMAGAAQDLDLIEAAWGDPALDAAGTRETRPLALGRALLVRRPRAGRAPALLGRTVPFLGLETPRIAALRPRPHRGGA